MNSGEPDAHHIESLLSHSVLEGMARLGVDEHAGANCSVIEFLRSPNAGKGVGRPGMRGKVGRYPCSAIPQCSLKTDTTPFRQEVRTRRSLALLVSMHSASWRL